MLKKGIVNDEHAYHLAMAEIIEHRDEIIRDGGLFMTFTSDPMCKHCRKTFWPIIVSSVEEGVPVTVLTKSGNFWNCEEYYWLRSLTRQRTLAAFGWTLTGHDELEPNAMANDQRIASMDIFSGEGFHTWASIEPVIDFPSSFQMIKQALNAGCQHFKIGLMTKNTKVCRKGFTIDGTVFSPYDTAECLAFVQDVMAATKDRATVYWKQSVRDFIGGTPAHRRFSDEELTKIFDNYPHSVTKDWSMFNNQ